MGTDRETSPGRALTGTASPALPAATTRRANTTPARRTSPSTTTTTVTRTRCGPLRRLAGIVRTRGSGLRCRPPPAADLGDAPMEPRQDRLPWPVSEPCLVPVGGAFRGGSCSARVPRATDPSPGSHCGSLARSAGLTAPGGASGTNPRDAGPGSGRALSSLGADRGCERRSRMTRSAPASSRAMVRDMSATVGGSPQADRTSPSTLWIVGLASRPLGKALRQVGGVTPMAHDDQQAEADRPTTCPPSVPSEPGRPRSGSDPETDQP